MSVYHRGELIAIPIIVGRLCDCRESEVATLVGRLSGGSWQDWWSGLTDAVGRCCWLSLPSLYLYSTTTIIIIQYNNIKIIIRFTFKFVFAFGWWLCYTIGWEKCQEILAVK